MFFWAIRMHGGHNDNPNARQFRGIYRKLLCTVRGHCSSAITAINSTTKSQRFDEEDVEISALLISNIDHTDEHQVRLCILIDNSGSHEYYRQIVGYIASCIVRQLRRKIKCMPCIDSLISNEKLDFHKLVGLRDREGLYFSSENVFTVCWFTEEVLRNYLIHKEIITETDYK